MNWWLVPEPRPPGQVYLVGGAVRDHLLGLPVGERDWVVVGAGPAAMQAAGFRPVGKDFPVFLHPHSGEEYALARTERKSGRGYKGFTVYAGPEVSLADDLRRRDLTINAIAMGSDGALIDPYGGQTDLAQRRLRHVSPAFAEDPLRVLRVARFAARFAQFDFRVAAETLALMRQLAHGGELVELVPERVWQEFEKVFAGPAPAEFFRCLRDCGALAVLVPDLDRQFGIPQPPRHHPEIDCGLHNLLALEQAVRLGAQPQVIFAVLCHDFGKGTTPEAVLPGHRGHEQRGVPMIAAFCERYKAPKAYRELAMLTAEFHLHAHRALELRAETLLKLFDRFDVWRRPERFEDFLVACEADARGRTGLEDRAYPQADYLRAALRHAGQIQAAGIAASGISGAAIGRELQRRRLNALRDFRSGEQQHEH